MQEDSDCIKYCLPQDPYGWMSNFYPAPFLVGSRIYPTSEHYFQSKKFQGTPEEHYVREAATPDDAFNLGRKYKYRPNWKSMKEKVMYEALRHKFNNYPILREKLLQTGNKKIIEHYQKDTYWSDGGNGSGQNKMGVLLMALRKQLRQQVTQRDVLKRNKKKTNAQS